MQMLYAAMMGTLSGVLGTGTGGLLSFLIRRPSGRLQAALLSATGGLMLSVVCFELLPEAFAAHSMQVGLAGFLAGVAFILVLDGLVWRFSATGGHVRSGILMLAGIAIHNFPEGLAIGSGYAHAPVLGAGLCAMIALHDVPEGLAVGIPLRQGGVRAGKAALLAALSGVPTGVGALAGYALGAVSPALISASMGLAGGAMLYLTVAELLPQAGDLNRGRLNGVALCLGVVLGIAAARWLG